MKSAYPAIIHAEGGSYWVAFPDLEGCFSDGDTVAEAASNAEEALGLYLCSLIERDIPLPAPTDIRSIRLDSGFATLVVADPNDYRRSTKSVKKTLTIPEWLNNEAEKRHINFSSVLQKALIAILD